MSAVGRPGTRVVSLDGLTLCLTPKRFLGSIKGSARCYIRFELVLVARVLKFLKLRKQDTYAFFKIQASERVGSENVVPLKAGPKDQLQDTKEE